MDQTQLSGTVLVSCAQASASLGLSVAAERCGYGHDISQFMEALRAAGREMGVEIRTLEDLQTPQQQPTILGGIEVAPETPDQL